MAIAARLAFSARRNEIRRWTIRLVGMDVTGMDLRMQVRLTGDTPGEPLIDLQLVTDPADQGLCLAGVEVVSGAPISTVTGLISKATMSSAAALPYAGDVGSDSRFEFGFQIDGVTRWYGDFWALASAIDSDDAPSNRPSGYGSGTRGVEPFSAAQFSFGDEIIEIQVDGVHLLQPIVDIAVGSAAAAAADRVQTGLDAAATAADRVQTGLDATATAADREQTGAAVADAEAAAVTATSKDASAQAAKTAAENAAASAGASANAAVGTTSTDSRRKLWRLTATTNVSLTYDSLPIIDGRQTVLNDRIFLPYQNNEAQNGLYVVGATALTRATDADSAAAIVDMYGWAEDGAQHAGRSFREATLAAVTLGTTPLVFLSDNQGAQALIELFAQPTGVVHIGACDSNWRGRTVMITNIPRLWTAIGAPLEGWTVRNMAQNGSQGQAWANSIQTGDVNQAPQDYPLLGADIVVNMHQVFNGGPTAVIMSPFINDCNSPANRSSIGPLLDDILDRLFLYAIRRQTHVFAPIPQPYGGIDFVAGTFSTDWAGDAAAYGFTGPTAAADNAAYWSQKIAACYLRWKDRNPFIHIIDTREIYNPGASSDMSLHRCDNPNRNCLDTNVAAARFTASITGTTMTVTAVEDGALRLDSPVNWSGSPTRWTNPTIAGAIIASQTSGTTNGVGVYELAAAPAAGDVSARQMTIFAKRIDDGLHFAEAGGVGLLNMIIDAAGAANKRRPGETMLATYSSTPRGDDAAMFQMLSNNRWARIIPYTNKEDGTNTLIALWGTPESDFLRTQAISRFKSTRPSPRQAIFQAELAMRFGNFSRAREITERGTGLRCIVIGGTGTIYQPSLVTFSSISPNPFYLNVILNGANLTGEPATGDLLFWTEEPENVPFSDRREIEVSLGNVRASPYGTLWQPTSFNLTRYATAGGSITVDLRAHNVSDGRFVLNAVTKAGCSISNTTLTTPNGTNMAVGQVVTGTGVTAGTVITGGSGTTWTVNNSQTVGPVSMTFQVNFGTSSGMVLGTMTLGAGIRQTSSFAANTTNRDLMIASGLWTSTTTIFQLGAGYWLDLVPSAGTDPGNLVMR